jgi:hypothetical protein
MWSSHHSHVITTPIAMWSSHQSCDYHTTVMWLSHHSHVIITPRLSHHNHVIITPQSCDHHTHTHTQSCDHHTQSCDHHTVMWSPHPHSRVISTPIVMWLSHQSCDHHTYTVTIPTVATTTHFLWNLDQWGVRCREPLPCATVWNGKSKWAWPVVSYPYSSSNTGDCRMFATVW